MLTVDRTVAEPHSFPEVRARPHETVLLGLDPGFASFGWAVLALRPDGEIVRAAGCIGTAKAKSKGLVRDDEQHRAAQLARELLRIAHEHDPALVCAEALSHVSPRGGRMPVSTTTKVGRAWGLVDMLCEQLEVALVQASPQSIKQVLCGTRSASKEQVQQALQRRYPELEQHLAFIPPSLREHPCDALGAIVASLHTNEVRLARRGAGSLN